jgi:hypothetical protein
MIGDSSKQSDSFNYQIEKKKGKKKPISFLKLDEIMGIDK